MSELIRTLLLSFVPALLAGLIASVITYLFTMRMKKFEILFHERVPAFKEILHKLNSLRRYCEAYAAQGDFTPRPRDLSEEDRGSALIHRLRLRDAVAENYVFLPRASIESLENVDRALNLLCHIEIEGLIKKQIDQRNEANTELHEHYYGVAEIVDKCIEDLYKQLSLPSG
jgi:hypothetical protein